MIKEEDVKKEETKEGRSEKEETKGEEGGNGERKEN